MRNRAEVTIDLETVSQPLWECRFGRAANEPNGLTSASFRCGWLTGMASNSPGAVAGLVKP